MLIDITNFNFECDDKGGSFLIDFNFACECNSNSNDAESVIILHFDESKVSSSSPFAIEVNGKRFQTTKTPLKLTLEDIGIDSTSGITSYKIGSVSNFTDAFALTKVEKLPIQDNRISMEGLFGLCQNLTEINIDDWILTYGGVDSAYGMFYGCEKLTSIKRNGQNASLLFENFSPSNTLGMFYGCKKLTSAPFVNLSKTTNANYMFSGCQSLTSITLPQEMLYIESTEGMFDNCHNLIQITESRIGANWTSGISNRWRNASCMFRGCAKLAKTPFDSQSKFDELTNISYMYDGCQSLTNINIGNDYLYYVTEIQGAFRGCSKVGFMSLDTLKPSTSNFTNLDNLFDGCSSLYTLTLGEWDLSNVESLNGIFNGCSGLNVSLTGASCSTLNVLQSAIEENGYNVNLYDLPDCNVGNRSDRFIIQSPINSLCEFAINGNWISFNENNEEISFFDKTLDDFKNEYGYDVTSVTFYGDVGNILDLPYTDTLQEITISTNGEIEYLDLSRVNLDALTNLDLRSLYSLVHLDLSNWQTVNITDNSQSWTNIPNLKTIKMLNCSSDAISFVQQKLGDGGYIIITEDNNTYITVKANSSTSDAFFGGSMQPLMVPVTDISDWGYSSFDGMSVDYMFESNTDIQSVFNLPSLSATTSHKAIFLDATNIQYLDCRKFDFNWTSDDQDINHMFYYCSSVKWLNLSGWDLTNAYNYETMLNNCSELKYIFAYGCNEDTIGKLNSAISNSGYSINLIY